MPLTLLSNLARPSHVGEYETHIADRSGAHRPSRWDLPFAGTGLPDSVVDTILACPVFAAVDGTLFPATAPLARIVAHDMRLTTLASGDTLYERGDYNTSVYMIVSGSMAEQPADNARATTWLSKLRAKKMQTSSGDANPPGLLQTGMLCGVSEALTRTRRDTTIAAVEDETIVLEVRWAGVRDLRQWSNEFRALTDHVHAQHAVRFGIKNCKAFSGLPDETTAALTSYARHEMFGSYEWAHKFKSAVDKNIHGISEDHEPTIVQEGDHLDEVIIVHSGFIRRTKQVGAGHRTLAALSAGDIAGLAEIQKSVETGSITDARAQAPTFDSTLRAMGYANAIRIPSVAIQELVLPNLSRSDRQILAQSATGANSQYHAKGQAQIDFAVDNRLVNGREVMTIDLDRCVNCDECVRACAATHNGVSRFVRTGITQANVMFAHACMHCQDATCLIGCPTGAIARDAKSGTVIVDEDKCIGCTICANNCAYDNIRMEPLRDDRDAPVIANDGAPVLKAVKCDLCAGQSTGPACMRACPHDAIHRKRFTV